MIVAVPRVDACDYKCRGSASDGYGNGRLLNDRHIAIAARKRDGEDPWGSRTSKGNETAGGGSSEN